jgi:hypothetical protein
VEEGVIASAVAFRECLDHVIVFNERRLRRVFIELLSISPWGANRLFLNKDCP